MNSRRTWIAALLLFAAGLVVGGVSGAALSARYIRQAAHKSPDAMKVHVMRGLVRALDLDEAQKPAVEAAVGGALRDLWVLRRNVEPRVNTILASAAVEMRGGLRPEQQKALDALLARWRVRTAPDS